MERTAEEFRKTLAGFVLIAVKTAMRVTMDHDGALCLADPVIGMGEDTRDKTFRPAKRIDISTKLRGGICLVDRLSARPRPFHGINAHGLCGNFQSVANV